MKLLIILVAVAAAQDCAGPIADFGDCITQAGNFSRGHKEGFATCFTDNGCKDPSEDREASRACRTDALKEAVGERMMDCAADNDVILRDDFLDMVLGHGGGRRGHKGGRGRRGGKRGGRRGGRGGEGDREGKFAAKIAAACEGAGEAAVENVRSCLEEQKAAKKAEWKAKKAAGGDKSHRRGGYAAFAQCHEQLSEECKAELEAQKASLCQCGKDLAEDEDLVESVKSSLAACEAEEESHDEEESDESDDEESSDDSDDDNSHGDRNPLQKILKGLCGHKGGRGGRGGKGGRRGGRRGGQRSEGGRGGRGGRRGGRRGGDGDSDTPDAEQTSRRGRWNRGRGNN